MRLAQQDHVVLVRLAQQVHGVNKEKRVIRVTRVMMEQREIPEPQALQVHKVILVQQVRQVPQARKVTQVQQEQPVKKEIQVLWDLLDQLMEQLVRLVVWDQQALLQG